MKIIRRMIKKGMIDSIDVHPAVYNKGQYRISMECDPPQYIHNQLVTVGKVIRDHFAQRTDILKAFSPQIWILVIISFFIYTFLNILIGRIKTRKLSMADTFSQIFTFAQPLINCGDCRKSFTLIYLIWLISIFPLVEIFKNDLFANLIALNETKIETIEALIQSNNDVYA